MLTTSCVLIHSLLFCLNKQNNFFSLKRTDDVEKQTRYQFFDIWDVDQYFLCGRFLYTLFTTNISTSNNFYLSKYENML